MYTLSLVNGKMAYDFAGYQYNQKSIKTKKQNQDIFVAWLPSTG